MDFGIARAVAEAQVTLPGTTLGSVHYFSPEQARGDATTAASDIYSLGIVLYEMLTGVRPWEGDSAAGVALARLSGPIPDPATVRPGLPPELAAIARQALAREPADRFPSASAMADQLESWLATPPPAPTITRPGVVGAAGAAGVAGRSAGRRVGQRWCLAERIRWTGRRHLRHGACQSGPRSLSPRGLRGDGRRRHRRRGRRGAILPTALAAHRRPRRNAYRSPGEDDAPGGPGAMVWLTGIAAIVMLAAIAFLAYQLVAGGGPAPSSGPGQVIVPSFVGQPFDTARQTADGLGITLVQGATQESGQPVGTILAQDPIGGTSLAKGGTVKVTLATSAALVPAPDLKNRTLSEAVQAIVDAGLRSGNVTQAPDPDRSARAGGVAEPLGGHRSGEGDPDRLRHLDRTRGVAVGQRLAEPEPELNATANPAADPRADADADPTTNPATDPRTDADTHADAGAERRRRPESAAELLARRAGASASPVARGAASPDLHAGVVERSAELDLRLADADAHLGGLEVRQEFVADRLGQGLEQAERGRLDDLPDRVVDASVVDRLRQVVVDGRRLQIEHDLDVDLERLGREQLVVVVAVAALEAHVGQDNSIAQLGPPWAAAGRQFARTMASLIRAARTLARTS